MNQIKTIDGHLNAADLKFAILATRFNDFIVDRLVGGAVDYLIRHGGSEENLTIVRVPGAFEMPPRLQEAGGLRQIRRHRRRRRRHPGRDASF